MQQKVLVLLSTYNGEKYLRQQIDSILAQEKVDVYIRARDDGSSDETVAILNDYCSKYDNFSVMEGNENLRPGNSFMELLYNAGTSENIQYDYYAFADQDDIWLKQKLIKAIEKIEISGDLDDGILYCSNQIIYKDETQCGLRFMKTPRMELASVINGNKVSGCTFVINHKLMRIICDAVHPSEALMIRRMHDVWIAIAALCMGKVIYDEQSYILYRIHENNVVGIRRKSMFKQLKTYWLNLTNKKYGNYRSWTAQEALNAFPETQGRNKEILEELSFYRRNTRMKIKLLNDTEVLSTIDNGSLIGKLKIILNIL